MTQTLEAREVDVGMENDPCIQEDFDIEEFLIDIRQRQDQIEFYKNLKKKRAAPIDSSIQKNEERIELLRSIISKYLENEKKKSLNFPGLGKVSISDRKGKWAIEDEAALAEKLKELEVFDNCGENIVKFNKTKLNKILNDLEANNNIPDVVSRETSDGKSLTLTFDKNCDRFLGTFDESNRDGSSEPNKTKEVSNSVSTSDDNFDSLDI